MKKFGFDNLLVNDREIFDAIYSQKKKLPDQKLIELCRNLGIFLSNNEDRESICKFISTQIFDWNLLKNLLNQINQDEVSNKTTSIKFSGGDLRHFREAIKEIAPVYEDNHLSHSGKGRNKFEVNLTTSSVELSNTRLIQKPLTDQNITVEKIGEDIIVRYDSDDVLEPIIKNLVDKVSNKTQGKLVQKEITLKDVLVSDYRSNFFLKLIVLDDNRYQLHDVKKIKLHHSKNNSSKEISLDEDDNTGYVTSAHFSGSSLHTNPLYNEMKKIGHYISEINWLVEDTQEEKLLEITAGFLNSKECNKFFYDIRCYYKKSLKGDRYTSERLKLNESEKSIFLKFFDNFTYETYETLIDEYKNSLVINNE